MTIKGSIYLSIPMLKRFAAEKSPLEIVSQNSRFSKIYGSQYQV